MAKHTFLPSITRLKVRKVSDYVSKKITGKSEILEVSFIEVQTKPHIVFHLTNILRI